MSEIIFHTPTKESYEDLMKKLDLLGYTGRFSGKKASEMELFEEYGSESAIRVIPERKEITYADREYYEFNREEVRLYTVDAFNSFAKNNHDIIKELDTVLGAEPEATDEQPTLPADVVEWIGNMFQYLTLSAVLDKVNREYQDEQSSVHKWARSISQPFTSDLANAQVEMAKAYIYGYKIATEVKAEKEQQYVIVFPKLESGFVYTYLDVYGDTDYTDNYEDVLVDGMRLTEAEILAKDERYMAFAVPVE